MFICQSISEFWFIYFILVETFLTQSIFSKKCCKTKNFDPTVVANNFDRDQNAAAIDQTTDHDRLEGWDRMFSHLCSMIS